MLEEATSQYHAALTGAQAGSPFARHAAWLEARGLELKDVRTNRLGVVDDHPAPGHYRHRGRIVIPYLDKHGKPLTLRFRCIEDHDHREQQYPHGKYASLFEDQARVYNVGAIHRADDVIEVTEGEFDALILCKLGLHAVAIPGARTWKAKPHYRRMLAGFNKIRVWADPDDAGAELLAAISKSMPRAKGVSLRDGDVTDSYIKGGAKALLDLI